MKSSTWLWDRKPSMLHCHIEYLYCFLKILPSLSRGSHREKRRERERDINLCITLNMKWEILWKTAAAAFTWEEKVMALEQMLSFSLSDKAYWWFPRGLASWRKQLGSLWMMVVKKAKQLEWIKGKKKKREKPFPNLSQSYMTTITLARTKAVHVVMGCGVLAS